jgi:short-subunit dehydrogenase
MSFIVITGASSGLGEALALEYGSQGRNLILVARRGERLQKLKDELLKQRPEIIVELLVHDVTHEDFANVLKAKCQPYVVDTVYCNAGFSVTGSFTKLTLADFRRQFETNVFGMLQTAQATMDSLVKTKGRLVLIGSLNSYMSFPLGSPYSMSKFMVRALAESLTCELHGAGVSVTLICPGPVESEILTINNKGQAGNIQRGRLPQPAMKASRAAHIIATAVAKRRREVFLRPTEWLLVALHRHFPALSIWAMQILFTSQRKYFEKLVTDLNPDAF